MYEIAKLSVLSNPVYIEKVQVFLKSLLEDYDFSPTEKTEIVISVDQALRTPLCNSMNAGEVRFVDVVFYDTGDTLEISIINNGLPFEIAEGEFDPLENDKNIEAAGKYIIQKHMDAAEYKNRGYDGQELRLIKNIDKRSVFNDVVKSQAEEIQEKDQIDNPDEINLTFRHIKKDEVLEITKCIYDEYKYTYVSEDIYYPERINRMIANGRLYSFVAIADDQMVAAHTALQRMPAYPMLLDTSIWVVKQKYRKLKIMKKLLPYSLEKAKEMEINGVFVEAVMHHPATQKISARYGFHAIGMLFNYTPGDTEVNYDAATGRRSLALGYMPVRKIENLKLYMPVLHKDFITDIYGKIGTDVKVLESDSKIELPEKTHLTVHINKYRNIAEIDIDTVGEDISAALLAEKKRLKIENLSGILLRVKMENPACAYVYEKALQSRFFFTGIMPHTGNGNLILLQNLLGNGVNYENLKALDEFSKVLNYVKTFDPDEFINDEDPHKKMQIYDK